MSGGSGSIATTENTSFDMKKQNARHFEPGIFLLSFTKIHAASSRGAAGGRVVDAVTLARCVNGAGATKLTPLTRTAAAR
jgi:hypothetical protein